MKSLELTIGFLKEFNNDIRKLVEKAKTFNPKDYAFYASMIFTALDSGDQNAKKIVSSEIQIIEKSLNSAGFLPTKPFCLIGGFLLTSLENVSVRVGDGVAVVNALMWAFHIVFISKLIKIYNYPIIVACLQCLIGGLFVFIPALLF